MKVDLAAGRLAVLVLDIQVLFAAEDGPFSNTSAGPMIDAVNALLAAARPAAVPVVHSRYVLRDDLRDAGLLATQGLDLDPFRRSSPLSAFDPRVDVAADDVQVEHHRPSAFFDADLDAILRSLGADRLVVCGLSVNNAVAATTREAYARDMPCVVVREATGAAPFEPAEDVEPAFRALDTWTAEVAALDDVRERLA